MAPAYYAQLRRRCAKWQGTIFVAEREGDLVGLVAVLTAVPFTELDEPPGTYALVTDLVVTPAARRRGYGRALLRQAERYARRQGARELRIGVLAGNQPALHLYRATGFRPWVVFLRKRLRAV
jgi:ribosomal protein S18 acetylase RimI-like enzyme